VELGPLLAPALATAVVSANERIGPTLERPAALNAVTLDPRVGLAIRGPTFKRSRLRSRQSFVASRSHFRQRELTPRCICRLRGNSSSGNQPPHLEQNFPSGSHGSAVIFVPRFRVYWRWNGSNWYACDDVTKKRHVCETKAAKAHERAEQEHDRKRRIEQEEQKRRDRQLREEQLGRERRERRRGSAATIAVWVAIAAAVLTWGYFDNSNSQPVPAPGSGQIDYPPADQPTAVCADGTYSYAANHQGACSWHGGVATWYR
jgi:Protein of unknown function (DUF3761)